MRRSSFGDADPERQGWAPAAVRMPVCVPTRFIIDQSRYDLRGNVRGTGTRTGAGTVVPGHHGTVDDRTAIESGGGAGRGCRRQGAQVGGAGSYETTAVITRPFLRPPPLFGWRSRSGRWRSSIGSAISASHLSPTRPALPVMSLVTIRLPSSGCPSNSRSAGVSRRLSALERRSAAWQSGYGKEGGRAGIEEFLVTKPHRQARQDLAGYCT